MLIVSNINDLAYGMATAMLISSRSRCVSHKVGCVIMKEGRFISSGYNGTAPGVPNCDCINKPGDPNHSDWSRKNEIHAEMNAILAAAKNGIPLQGCTLITTLSPCPDCCKNIAVSGISQIVYLEEYGKSEPDWVDKCKSYGIAVTQLSKSYIDDIFKNVRDICTNK